MYYQESHTQPRTREIEATFQENKDQILADLESLELTIRGIAAKWNVQDRNVRRWAERLDIDLADRQMRRRSSGYEKRGRPIRNKPKREDFVRNPTLLSMRW